MSLARGNMMLFPPKKVHARGIFGGVHLWAFIYVSEGVGEGVDLSVDIRSSTEQSTNCQGDPRIYTEDLPLIFLLIFLALFLGRG